MTVVAVQRGHCFRKSGSTGTYREQEMVSQIGSLIKTGLEMAGLECHLLLADPPGRIYPEADMFLALHCDGSVNSAARGASFFYPTWSGVEHYFDIPETLRYADLWKDYHQDPQGAAYGGGIRSDNYVSEVGRTFYAWRADRVQSGLGVKPGTSVVCLCEHYFATNAIDDKWAWDNQVHDIADAHLSSIIDLFGKPVPEPEEEELLMKGQMVYATKPDGGNTAQFYTVGGLNRRRLTNDEKQWYHLVGWLERLGPYKIGYKTFMSIPVIDK